MITGLQIGIALGLALFAVIVYYVYPRYVKPELGAILKDLESTVTKLETFTETKTAEIATHLEEIALHQSHISLKTSDRDRAQRVVERLNELLK